ncbi:Mitochondrial phosphate carrier protein 2, mitochondrial [Zancudomyces culisetae]|uniref:Mitochondrial phosphate carrier protein 2, mitochondrial n=1 Tax=Zancudomyces culisetae TaxID=1213189 RepID=A0A1R1PKN9_ZANCU|nr:Mitochondrial phosphate carrier protein 2, mitochondrial [Zancudomyces culisetae]|eukprot:OMH81524.1 Mitochondrial phosphate carrier protein 2, mitochondrial [Zancudomyces culisetae]
MYPSKDTLTTSFKGPGVANGKGFVAHSPIEINSSQVNRSLYTGIFNGWSTIGKASGLKGLYTGGIPALIGYSMQGAAKYGFYDYFKYKYTQIAGEEFATKYKTLLYLSASASAEFIADVALCPMEALKVKMQTSVEPFAPGFLAGVSKIAKAEGLNGFYKGLVPLWLRQIPYTMVKFATFENTVSLLYKHVMTRPKDTYSKVEQLGVTFSAGYIAGVFCAIVSHPADVLVSKLNNIEKAPGQSTGALAGKIMKDLGFSGIWTGLGPRILMVGTLTALQWFIYDTYKVQVGLPASGSSEPAKKVQ